PRCPSAPSDRCSACRFITPWARRHPSRRGALLTSSIVVAVPELREERLARVAHLGTDVGGPCEIPAAVHFRPSPAPPIRVFEGTVMGEPSVIHHVWLPRLLEELEHRLQR